MPTPATDTIAAIATPPGRGGVCVIRVSGPRAAAIAKAVTGQTPKPRHATFARFRDGAGNVIDEGIALYFPAPRSFTGEDVVELQGHGGVVVSDMVLQATLANGARMARPGEFSERAFLNDKMDLAQAEAVADLIDAGTTQAARAAARTMEGEFSKQIDCLQDELTALRVYIESAMDFADEDIEFIKSGDIATRLRDIDTTVKKITAVAGRGRVLNDGVAIVIAGRPNAGKSSLFNALSGRESAIVSPAPGTTRDIVRERVTVDGLVLHIQDTAGIRPLDDNQTHARIEAEGIRRALTGVKKADITIWVRDDTAPADTNEPAPIQAASLLVVLNKIDRSGRPPGRHTIKDRAVKNCQGEVVAIAVSATTGAGLNALREEITRRVIGEDTGENEFSARRRHTSALEQTQTHLRRARRHLEAQLKGAGGGELLAEEMRLAQQHLSEITGAVTADDLLGRIFAEFCIGK